MTIKALIVSAGRREPHAWCRTSHQPLGLVGIGAAPTELGGPVPFAATG
jgi:hypothetical protein